MPNHWHFVLWPRGDGDLSELMRWLTVTHTQRWHTAHGTAGTGPLYQGRFKSFRSSQTSICGRCCGTWSETRCGRTWSKRPRRGDGRFFWHRVHGNPAGLLDRGPAALPGRWPASRPQSEAELEALRRSVVRGSPFGEASWQDRTAKRLGLQSTLRGRGRPCKPPPVEPR